MASSVWFDHAPLAFFHQLRAPHVGERDRLVKVERDPRVLLPRVHEHLAPALVISRAFGGGRDA